MRRMRQFRVRRRRSGVDLRVNTFVLVLLLPTGEETDDQCLDGKDDKRDESERSVDHDENVHNEFSLLDRVLSENERRIEQQIESRN